MKRISLILIVVLASTGCLRKPLDHFRFYEVQYEYETIPGLTDRMKLRGQLDTAADNLTFQIRSLNYFGVPVIKNEENDNRYLDPNDHLAWYNFVEPGTEAVAWKVTVKNQYTNNEEITFNLDNKPYAVLVPTWKKKGNLGEPQKLSHFKLYRILNGVSVNQTAHLKDQFLDNTETVIVPVFFAVPVSKRVRNKEYPIKSEPHLTIYKLSETTVPEPRELFEIKNQFQEERRYKTVKSFYLAVPTEKTGKTRTELPPPHQD